MKEKIDITSPMTLFFEKFQLQMEEWDMRDHCTVATEEKNT